MKWLISIFGNSLGIYKWLHPTLCNVCNYLSMLWSKSIHVSKRGPIYSPCKHYITGHDPVEINLLLMQSARYYHSDLMSQIVVIICPRNDVFTCHHTKALPESVIGYSNETVKDTSQRHFKNTSQKTNAKMLICFRIYGLNFNAVFITNCLFNYPR